MVIGVVGKSCSGKNYICKIFNQRGYKTIDLDKIGHESLKVNKKKLVDLFGDDILSASGDVDRKILGRIVFSSSEQLKKLEGLSFPFIMDKVKQEIKNSPKLVINGAVLHRGKIDELCDYIVFVDSSFETRWQRAKIRDKITKEAFLKRESSQDDIIPDMRLYACPLIIMENEGEYNHINRQVNDFCDKIDK